MPTYTKAELIIKVADNVRSNGLGGLTRADEVRSLLTDFVNSIFDSLQIVDARESINFSNTVKLTGDQVIAGAKSFSSIVVSSTPPTANNHLTNKGYVDAAIAAIVATVSGDQLFDSSDPIKRQVAGLEGVVLNGSTVAETLTALLYGVKSPKVSGSVLDREKGNSFSEVFYTLEKTDTPLTLFTINGGPVSIVSPGNTQSGSIVVPAGASTDTTFNLSLTAVRTGAAAIVSKSLEAIYYGESLKSGLSITPLVDADIAPLPRSLDAFVKKIITFSSLRFLVIACRSNVAFIKINGLQNNDFTIVRANTSFVNQFGHSYVGYNVYVSAKQLVGTFELEITYP